MTLIPFNLPYVTGREAEYLKEALSGGYIAGNGRFTKKCTDLMRERYGYGNSLLTTSCTDALEMAAILSKVGPGDEVIVPAYTFVSTALAFARQGADIVFADSRADHPGIDEERLGELLSERTKVIVPVHYGGRMCDMEKISSFAAEHNLLVVEDAAHAFGCSLKGVPAGKWGSMGCFSFHETKVIHCGEGGMINVNDPTLFGRAEMIWEKGTDRCAFARGEVPFYSWHDTGSSFLMSDLNASFLAAQIEEADRIIAKRKLLWETFYHLLSPLAGKGLIKLPPAGEAGGECNYYTFYILTSDKKERENLQAFLNASGIQAVTHYLNLAASPYALSRGWGRGDKDLQNCIRYQETLLRLPLYFSLEVKDSEYITGQISAFYGERA